MATAAMNVMQHYNIKASQKAIDWGNLLLTCGLIYGGKFASINERRKNERAARRQAQAEAAAPFGLTPAGNG